MNYVNGLHFNNIRGDIYGGLTAAVVALPLAMVIGDFSGAVLIAGMYGAIFVGLSPHCSVVRLPRCRAL